MIRRLDLFGRLILILLGALVLLGTLGVTLFYVRESHRPVFARIPFPRLQHAAGIIDLAASEPAERIPMVLRAGNGVDVVTRLASIDRPSSDLRYAPRLTARLRIYLRSKTPVRAYTSVVFTPRRSADGVEGYMARAVARLADGRLLVMDMPSPGDTELPRLFGLPASQWMGAAATLIVLLALWGTARETRPLRRVARAMRAFDGTAVTISGPLPAAADIRRTGEAAAAMQARVMTLLGERSLMIGAISHDLRTVLTRMRLRVAALDDPAARAALERDLERMDAMLSDALAFARGTAIGPERLPIDLADIAASEAAERDARGQQGAVDLALDDAPCLGDALALRRVVANLIDNAIKYGRDRVVVTTGSTADHAWLAVEDDGPGISPDQRAEMLQPYCRGERARRAGLAGSGLGLAIVQQIVGGHRGTIAIGESTYGGAQVTISLPLNARPA